MLRNVGYCVVWLAALLLAETVLAQGKRLEDNLAELEGKKILYSSPYLAGDKAVELEVKEIKISDDFYDDGIIFLDGKDYAVDQLFMENENGIYENLLSLYHYDGVGQTFLLRYYDKGRKALKEEKAELLKELADCSIAYNGESVKEVYKEVSAQSECIDNVYKKFIKQFYSYQENELWEDYQKMVKLWFSSYMRLAHPDSCYGRCGMSAAMFAGGNAIDEQEMFVRGAISLIDVE